MFRAYNQMARIICKEMKSFSRNEPKKAKNIYKKSYETMKKETEGDTKMVEVCLTFRDQQN